MNEQELIKNLSELAIEADAYGEVFISMINSITNKDENGIRLLNAIKKSNINTKEKLFKMTAKVIAEEIYKERKRLRFFAMNN